MPSSRILTKVSTRAVILVNVSFAVLYFTIPALTLSKIVRRFRPWTSCSNFFLTYCIRCNQYLLDDEIFLIIWSVSLVCGCSTSICVLVVLWSVDDFWLSSLVFLVSECDELLERYWLAESSFLLFLLINLLCFVFYALKMSQPR